MKKRLQFYLNYYETLTTKKIPDHRRGRQGTRAIAHSNSIFSARTSDSLNRDSTFCTAYDIEFICQPPSSKTAGTSCTGYLISCAFNSIHLSLLPLGKRRAEVVRILRQT